MLLWCARSGLSGKFLSGINYSKSWHQIIVVSWYIVVYIYIIMLYPMVPCTWIVHCSLTPWPHRSSRLMDLTLDRDYIAALHSSKHSDYQQRTRMWFHPGWSPRVSRDVSGDFWPCGGFWSSSQTTTRTSRCRCDPGGRSSSKHLKTITLNATQ